MKKTKVHKPFINAKFFIKFLQKAWPYKAVVILQKYKYYQNFKYFRTDWSWI